MAARVLITPRIDVEWAGKRVHIDFEKELVVIDAYGVASAFSMPLLAELCGAMFARNEAGGVLVEHASEDKKKEISECNRSLYLT